MGKVKNNFHVLLAEKETKDGKTYSHKRISEMTGLSRTTLASYAKNRVERFDSSTLETLCNFLECDLAKLLTYKPETGH